MTAPDRRAVLRWFAAQPRSVRVHVRLREATMPLGAVAGLLPERGRILDWGTGHGLLALRIAAAGGRSVTGTDVDGAKVASATEAAAAAGLSDVVTFEEVSSAARPGGTWDGIVLSDVLYLQAPPDQEALVRAAAHALAPGGVLVCKELAATPRWKRRLCRVQEQVSVRVLRITSAGSGISDFPLPDLVASWMEAEGLAVQVRPLDRGYHAPHVAVVGRRPTSNDR